MLSASKNVRHNHLLTTSTDGPSLIITQPFKKTLYSRYVDISAESGYPDNLCFKGRKAKGQVKFNLRINVKRHCSLSEIANIAGTKLLQNRKDLDALLCWEESWGIL